MDVYDDYAHSPMKINASINAIYDCYPKHNIIMFGDLIDTQHYTNILLTILTCLITLSERRIIY